MDIIDVAELMANISPARVLRDVLGKPEVQQYIIELNTEGQLLEGVNSLGVKLSTIGGNYSVRTMKLKGLTDPTKVNLFDTGDYYKSFIIVPLNSGDFVIKSDPIKEDNNLEKRYGKDLEGLTNENLEKLNIYLEDKIIEHLEFLLN